MTRLTESGSFQPSIIGSGCRLLLMNNGGCHMFRSAPETTQSVPDPHGSAWTCGSGSESRRKNSLGNVQVHEVNTGQNE